MKIFQIAIFLSCVIYSLQAKTCGDHFVASKGSFHSPNYPENYEAAQTCKWVIEVPAGSIVELKFIDFNTDKWSDTCDEEADIVQIFDGDNEQGAVLHPALCGKNKPGDFRSTSNFMTVVLKSGEFSFGSKGFKATFAAISGDVSECVFNECGGEIHNVQSCKLQSPGYPNGYSKDQSCTWVINAPESGHVNLKFLDLSLKGLTSKCSQNNVTLYDGQTADKKKLIYEPVCDLNENKLASKDFTSTGSSIVVVFRTSELSPSGGFSAQFSILESTSKAASIPTSSTTSTLPPTTTTVPSTTTSSNVQSSTTTTSTTNPKIVTKSPGGRSMVSTTTNNPKPKSTSEKTSEETTESQQSTSQTDDDAPMNNAAAVSGLVIGCIVGLVLLVFAILLIITFVHWKRQNHRFNIRLQEEDARSDVNTLISSMDSNETVYKGKKYGKIVRIPASEEFSPL